VEINRGVPVKWVAELVASKYDQGTVYMAQNGKRDDDFLPYLWKSTDYGESWVSIVNNLPTGPVNVIKEDPKNSHILYVGTDVGMYLSLNGGQEWQALPGGDLPSSFYQDLVIHPREDILVAATHGRGLWAMDVRPIQQLTPEVQEAPLRLFEMGTAQLPRGWRDPGFGAFIRYWMRDGAAQVTVTVKDAAGEVVRELTGDGDPGMNGITWDLTLGAGEGPRSRPRRVAPGEYQVVVTGGGASAEGTLIIVN
jgi:hypothetical protein